MSASHPSRSAWPGLVAWLAVTFAAAAVGGVASGSAGSFYGQLDRPAWAPPGWLFGPVWSLLYLLMGVSAFLIWRERATRDVRGALGLYLAQLALNALWTWLFFAWRRGGLALAEIVVLIALVVATMAAFARVRRDAALLLAPYLAWITFAAFLTAAVWRRNPGLL